MLVENFEGLYFFTAKIILGGEKMVNRAFQYYFDSEKWIECTDEKFINDDIEKLPVFLVIKDYEEISIFCSQHKNLEKIQSATHKTVISKNGCKFYGLFGKAVLEEVYHYYGDGIFVAFRWRIF